MAESRSKTVLYRGVLALSIFSVLELGSWYLVGRNDVLHGFPRMVHTDLEYLYDRSAVGSRAARSPSSLTPLVVTSPDTTLEPPEPAELRATLEEFGFSPRWGATAKAGDGGCVSCSVLEYRVDTNTPLYARVVTYHHRRGGAGELFMHERLWLLGVWLPISDRFYGSS